MTNTGRRRSTSVSVMLAASVALALTGCADDYDQQSVCVDQKTGKRIDDRQCDQSGSGRSSGSGRWYYYGRESTLPGTGQQASGGSFTEPHSGSVTHGGAPREGGSVSRGGFGGHAGSGGHGGSVGG